VADLVLDPSVVEEQVRKLNRQADSLGVLGVILAAPFGAVIGGFPLVAHGPIPSKYGIATVLLGALLTGVLGHIIASGRAFGYRLRGQLMLGQLRLEQNVEALLAVSERPVTLAALPAAEPQPVALPEPPRIEELFQAGLAMPESAPVVEHMPTVSPTPVEPDEIAPLPAAEAEVEVEEVAPLPVSETTPDPLPLPSWAADLEHTLATFAPSLTPASPVTPEPEPEPNPVWAVPVHEEPAHADLEHTLATFAPSPTPVSTVTVEPEPEPTQVWAVPVHEEPVHQQAEPTPVWAAPVHVEPVHEEAEPTPVWAAPVHMEPVHDEPSPAPTLPVFATAQDITTPPTHAPLTPPALEETRRQDFGSTTPVWALPATEQQPEAAPAPAAAAPAPDEHPDLSTMSIAEIARLAERGSI
jgi:hypothetical protein